MSTDLLGFDFETHLMGPQKVAPPPVCISAHLTGPSVEEPMTVLSGVKHESEDFEALIDVLFESTDELTRIAHNLSFDLMVAVNHRPEAMSAVFDFLIEGKFQCTLIREKLLNLTQWGSIDFIDDGMGDPIKVDYSLAGLMMQHFAVDRFEDKKGADAWRLNYAELEDQPVDEWPEAAVSYAKDDADDAVRLWIHQEVRRGEIRRSTGVDPFETLNFQCSVDFCLSLMTAWGFAIDADAVAEMEQMLEVALSPDNMVHLIDSGILRPAEEPRPHKNGAKNEDGTPKMTKGKPASVNKKVLQEFVEKLCKENDIEVLRTEPSKKFPDGQISTASEVIEDIYTLDPALGEYRDRQKLQKLVTTEIPRLKYEGEVSAVVHPGYDVLKRTGRTSSFASKLYPSFNCQNVDPRVRGCIVSRPGTVLYSIDYNQMELGTLAQRCLDLFGHSVLADKINKGYDLHSYLGAQIAIATGALGGAPEDNDEAYLFFLKNKTSDDPEKRAFWKHYRTLAKPTGLGYPGGLGAETFVRYAHATYGVEIDLATAELLRDVWKQTFDEMPDYFDFINKECIDETFSDGPYDRKYAYSSPFGMYRPNADYCAAANGLGLQTPSSEGAKLGVLEVVRHCFDPSLDSPLLPDKNGRVVSPIGFIHDEQIGEIRYDDRVTERIAFIEDLMVQAMRQVTPDVEARAEAALMYRWDKRAEPVFDADGNLIPWEPEKE